MPDAGTPSPEDVLSFWLDEIGPDGWYKGGDEIDDLCRARFLPAWEAARVGRLHDWPTGARGALALVILTDQFPRNMFRGDARAFATDPLARATARAAIDRGHDREITGDERQFFYLPFEHSELPADQELSVALSSARLGGTEAVLHARAHREVIRRFGRFPFRNTALGRDSTPAERAFLDAGGYPALVREMRAAMQSTHGSPPHPPS